MNFKAVYRLAVLVVSSVVFNSCATYHAQSGSKKPIIIKGDFKPSEISHTVLLIGDAGNADKNPSAEVLRLFENRLMQCDTNSTVIFLGDNIYERGMPPKGTKGRPMAEEKLNRQLQLTRNFKGKTIFIPGNHDWYNGIEGMKEQEKMVNEFYKPEIAFLPQNTCGIETMPINNDIAMIIIDSYWYLQDWDKLPEINSGCEIKTREQFFDRLEDELTRNQNKTILLAIHHPLMTHGSHGGEFPFREHLFPLEQDIPLPIIGTLGILFRKTSGVSVQDIQNKKYGAMARRIKTLIANKPNVIVISGHDHNLQYIDQDGIKQIISGSGSKNEGARAIGDKDFSYGRNGYAELQIRKAGGAKVSFYGITSDGKEGLLAEREPLIDRPKPNLRQFSNHFAAMKDTSVYAPAMTEKKPLYRFFWGKHFRKQYGIKVTVPQVSLDTLYGGLAPQLAGDDEQARSLTLEHRNGNQYVMRALRKNATRFLQAVAFKDQFVEEDFRNTFTEEFILDFYTTSHPYMPLVVAGLAQRIGVNHPNPRLYYIPKQDRLELFNDDFGNELYLVEEHPTDAFRNLKSFGKPVRIIDTEQLLENLIDDRKYVVDEEQYIRARLFDMLIGDWDRGAEQWQWGEYHENGKVIYRPIPLNRDQAFTKFDGALFKIIMNFPPVRHMKSFDDKLKNVKWFNRLAYNLDLALITNSDKAVWQRQADYIVSNLSDSEIDLAFKNLPSEMQDADAQKIREQLKARKLQLGTIATEYYNLLQKIVLIPGSVKKDKFIVTRNAESYNVKVFELDGQTENLAFNRNYDAGSTNELWLYGLSEDDVFEVRGTAKKIKLRLMGGGDKDLYDIEDGKKVKIYDFISTDNDLLQAGNAKLALSDSYERNNYDYQKPKYNILAGYPNLGFNPDDGIKVGAVVNYSINTFNSYPLAQKHSITGNYYFATGGYELLYKGFFPGLFHKWDFVLDALYTSPNFSINFFGFGNETSNRDDSLGKDYNRVKMRTVRIAPSIEWTNEEGSSVVLQTSYERNRVEQTGGRFIAEPGVVNSEVFNYQDFVDINAKYTFANYDNISNPTLGMTFSILGGYKLNLNETSRQIPYTDALLGFNYRLSTTGNWVLATVVKGRVLFSDDYEFYQAATVGGDLDLRGFRNGRFTGKHSFLHSTDLRWNLGKFKNGLAPIYYGVFGGYDYGRVWLPNDYSEQWHQSAGGGLWLNGVNLVTAKLSYFYSSDGGRVSFGLGFGF